MEFCQFTELVGRRGLCSLGESLGQGDGVLCEVDRIASSLFHSMSAQKIKGAREAISVLKNNVRFANICNDVIGDVCGIVSGGLGSVLAVSLSKVSSVSLTILSVILAAFISAFTVGGKAVFKGVAIKNCNQIIFVFGKLKSLFHVK